MVIALAKSPPCQEAASETPDHAVSPVCEPVKPEPEAVSPKRAAQLQWAALIARIYEKFPLVCHVNGEQMRIIAFITHRADIQCIFDHIGADPMPPNPSPPGGLPLLEDFDAHGGEEGVDVGPD